MKLKYGFASVIPVFAFVWLMGTTPAEAECGSLFPGLYATFEGEVRYVMDGDTLCLANRGGTVRVRLADFNAAELDEQGGSAAKQILSELTLGSRLTCTVLDHSLDAVVALCMINIENVGNMLRAKGARENRKVPMLKPSPPLPPPDIHGETGVTRLDVNTSVSQFVGNHMTLKVWYFANVAKCPDSTQIPVIADVIRKRDRKTATFVG
jgi:hypothetical protein